MTTTLNTLITTSGSRRRKKRIGRGNASGHGTYATRGQKGQRSRSGGRRGLKKLGMKRIIAALPKLGGFTSRRVRPAEINIRELSRFAAGEAVTLETLKAKGLVHPRVHFAKLIGAGPVPPKLSVSGVATTAGARAAIEKAGGKVV